MKEPKEIFSRSFIQSVYNTCFPCDNLDMLMKYLEEQDTLKARTVLHDITEALKPPIEEIIDDGDRIIYNGKVNKYLSVNKIYDQLLSLLDKEDKIAYDQLNDHYRW